MHGDFFNASDVHTAYFFVDLFTSDHPEYIYIDSDNINRSIVVHLLFTLMGCVRYECRRVAHS